MIDQIPYPKPGAPPVKVDLAGDDGVNDRVHLLSELEIGAINAALAAGRPLLVRGEPGTGKTQLARAAAKVLGRAFVQHVIDSHSESRDLLWTFDAVKRLADAQIAGALKTDKEQAAQTLEVGNYLHPGPLWWVFDWDSAARQSATAGSEAPDQPDGGDPAKGCVLLLDEIDKAESELPNGLLESLGARSFTPFGRCKPITVTDKTPLIVITSNEERTLPDAFIRRCMVLRLTMPDRALLIERGRRHFSRAGEDVLEKAADLLFRDREAAVRARVRPLPGQAEYFDMMRTVLRQKPGDSAGQIEKLDIVARYTLTKYAGLESISQA